MHRTSRVQPEWIQRALDEGASYIIVVCDTFDFDDYPVYVYPGQDPHKIANEYDQKSMQKVEELFSLDDQ